MSRFLRCIGTFAAMTCLLVACGGRSTVIEDVRSPDGASPVDASPQGDAGTADVVASDAAPPIDAKGCVSIDPSRYDVSCNVESDCVTVGIGTLCAGDCVSCRGDYAQTHYGVDTFAISAASLPKYDADTAVLKGACPVVADTMCTGFPATCVEHRCVRGEGG